MRRSWLTLLLAALVGCGSSDSGSSAADAAVEVATDAFGPDAGSVADAGEPADTPPADVAAPDAEAPDAAVSDTAAPDAEGSDAEAGPGVESEPNDGTTLDEFDALAVGGTVTGTLGTPGDADVFRFAGAAGHVYRVTLAAPAGSPLHPHLAVFDDGRDGHAAGEDQVKVVRGAAPAVVDLLAMGSAGYFVAVRDARTVDGTPTGGPELAYTLAVAAVSQPALTFPSTATGTLASPGALALYPFTGGEGEDVRFDLQASGDMDGRLLVFSAATGSWIARNDDRALGEPDPLIDAPLTASGDMLLVVENVADAPGSLGYSLTAAKP